jgi:hypothetical protein
LELRRTQIGKFRVDDAIRIDLFSTLFLTNGASGQGVS